MSHYEWIGAILDRGGSSAGAYDQTDSANAQQTSSTIQCLDFYYYMSDIFNDARIQAGWKLNTDTEQIIEVTPRAENKWHRSQSNFVAPSSSSYQLAFRMIRNGPSTNFYFSLDEIKIYDVLCSSGFTATATTTISI
ncbi:unnamed protein product [Rotaria socialis]|uniref:MAM domain-containing protein n=1 Tax=Rotaria socialis TaxID=392032 RepID=A0A820NMK6_9BILA|nr:unnamed protein product [Rotaria socialis]